MATQSATLDSKRITDWESFHSVFAELMGFPGFYGRNMDAWIDCMSYLDAPNAQMTSRNVEPGEQFRLEIIDTEGFQQRLPDIFGALITCTAYVNCRFTDRGEPPILALILL